MQKWSIIFNNRDEAFLKGKISREEYKEDLHATDAIGPLALGIAFGGPGAVGEELITFIFETVTGVPLFNDPSDFIKTSSKKVEKEVAESSTKLIKKGRSGKQAKLKSLVNDPKLGKSDKGWIKQEINSVKRGSKRMGKDGKLRPQKNLRNPPGKDLAHPYKQRAKDGFSYKNAKLKNVADHKIEHKIHGYK